MLLTERYKEQIAGVISCYDRLVIQGTLPGWCFAGGMTSFLNANKIRIFDYPQFANTLREELRSHADAIAAEYDLKIEFIRKFQAFRKDDRIKKILKEHGSHPGLVHIFSAMESCTSYKPWNKIAPMKKNIYSLYILAQLLKDSNRRYLEFISTFEERDR